ncbi:MAG: hypothetical protein LIO58_01465, partial [Oscillospiraceae bacterium]|nr:hypothetical protein [Oscillospiraceae bacterium]
THQIFIYWKYHKIVYFMIVPFPPNGVNLFGRIDSHPAASGFQNRMPCWRFHKVFPLRSTLFGNPRIDTG